MIREFVVPKTVYLYDEGIKNPGFREIKYFLEKNFAWIKARLIKLEKKVVCVNGLLFDFIRTEKAFQELEYSRDKDACHIILTDKLFATLERDNRPHIRAGIYGFPSVISITGLVEGPAKPREYYSYKQRYTQLGAWDTEEAKLKEKFRGSFLDYQDKRMSEVLKGYIAQGLFFYIMLEPFCKRRVCRLFNAHWQEDLIYAQIKTGRFCKPHQRLLKDIGAKAKILKQG